MKNNFFRFFLNIILPTIFAICLFIVAMFLIIIPQFEKNILNKKREMIRELTNSSWSILSEYYEKETTDSLTKEIAQEEAILRIKNLRYGNEGKDYFWITDTIPIMIMHPYRSDLNGEDLSNFQDPTGKKLFVEFVDTVNKNTEGFVDYMWQWKDDSTKIVPKLSFVKEFEPWGWIIGTGIYIEDVNKEISLIKNNLIKISLLIVLIISFLLILIMFQSLKIEKKRQNAETELLKSKEKYKGLVQTANEGTLMLVNDNIIFSNKIIQNILGYSPTELNNKNFFDILANEESVIELKKIFHKDNFIKSKKNKYNTILKKKDSKNLEVIINISLTKILTQTAYILKINEINRTEFEKKIDRFQDLTDHINIGIFRTTIGKRGKFIETNNATLNILGFKNKNNLFSTNIIDLFHDKKESYEFNKELSKKGIVKNKIIRLIKTDAKIKTIAVSAMLTKDDKNKYKYCDGIIEDISEQKLKEENREKQINELQSSLLFFNQSIKHFIKPAVNQNFHSTLTETANTMNHSQKNVILVSDNNGNYLGIITDSDIRKRAVSKSLDYSESIYKIMSSPIITISEKALLFEAIVLMQNKNISHLAVTDAKDKIIGLINKKELLQVIQNTSIYHLKHINSAKNVDELIKYNKKLPQIIKVLIETGADASHISRIITSILDAITNKLISFAICKLGEPPCKFSFITLGSIGREELTLSSDQDNAIIIEDFNEKNEKEILKYFQELGEIICDWLNSCGYDYCPGDIMAKNKKWCQPLQIWKRYFSSWIESPDAHNIMDICTFFDMRVVYGENNFVHELKTYYYELLKKNDIFFYLLSESILKFKTPVDLFGNIKLSSNKNNIPHYDIKKILISIVGFSRIYSIKHNIFETNTLSRSNKLYENNIISKELFDEITPSFNYLMLLRYKRQVFQLNNNNIADNFIEKDNLSELEESMLKKIISKINNLFTKLKLDFHS